MKYEESLHKDPRDRFTDAGNDYLLDIDFAKEIKEITELSDDHRLCELGCQSITEGIPLRFITFFCLERVFVPLYENVEFGLAIKALDYLQDLEWKSRDTVHRAIQRLSITSHNWRDVLSDDYKALEWVKDTQNCIMGLEVCFADLYIGLRIWVCIFASRFLVISL